jgi:hypothetical protein
MDAQTGLSGQAALNLHDVMRDAAADVAFAVADAGQQLVDIIDDRESVWINGDPA